MTLLRSIFIISYFIFSTSAIADPASTSLAAHLDATQTMQANFTQIIYDNKNKAIQKSYGNMALKRPGQFRWEVIKPIPQMIIANKTKLWIYDPDLQQVTIRSLNHTEGETPALLLSHDHSALEHDYVVKQLPEKTNHWEWFSLKPKKTDNMFSQIDMGFTNNQIQKMVLADHLGHKTEINFQKIRTNIPLIDTLFVFKPSNKMDVIDETRKK